MEDPKRQTLGWNLVERERKRELIDAIASGAANRGPAYVELDLNDRCNVACYFCNQQDVRTQSQIPLPRAVELIDELVLTGLRSVRLSGGGDPLFHKEIVGILDHLAERNIVIDNVTTNGVALTDDIATRLVENEARELILSLNAVDGEDYHRMMRVKPGLFDQALDNVRHLIELRGDAPKPAVVVQFLLDQDNLERVAEMYDLGRSLRPDRIAINMVLNIPGERIASGRLLTPGDIDRARPLIEEIFYRDLDAQLVQIDFPAPGWQEMLAAARVATGHEPLDLFPTAPTFKDENGGCFFAWYSSAVSGNGDLYPCCLLMQPDLEPLGNIRDASFAEQWNGPRYQTMRDEMRQVLLDPEGAAREPERFKILREPCIQPHSCWLKNIYFRADEEFYQELGTALDGVREKERVRAEARELKQRARSFIDRHPRWNSTWDLARERTRPLRTWIARRTGLPVTEEL